MKIPILIINGKFDTNNPPDAVKKNHQNLKMSDLILIEKAGHFHWVEQKDETFNGIFSW